MRQGKTGDRGSGPSRAGRSLTVLTAAGCASDVTPNGVRVSPDRSMILA